MRNPAGNCVKGKPGTAQVSGKPDIALPIAGVVNGGAGQAATAPNHSRPNSTMGRWRAAVLIAVHCAILAHIAQWLLSGLSDGVKNTLSPVEPSETMYTLEVGRLNAGFIMFVVAIASTLLFGRFFCGWLCHIVALQDLCGYLMKKMGIHPKPWRSRLLVWVPVVMGAYMFLWPTFRRELLRPLLERTLGAMPVWIGESTPLRGFTSHFIVEDFWATFPPWYIFVPFLLLCGFATVYFLGAKAFCTYGCPYGGIFGPVDRLSPFRIKVNDNCNQCGHCTAVCTSNVRTSEEVNNYGVVIDPGCMKTLDCVNACPNDALSVGFALPAVFTKPRDVEGAAASNAKRQARYDLTLREELAFGVVLFIMFYGFRGLYGAIPLLMAAGVASIATFMVHKMWRLLRDANVRGPFRQLKRSGKLTGFGYAFVLFGAAYSLVGLQGFVMHLGQWQANLCYDQIDAPSDVVYAPGYIPDPRHKALAERALAWGRPSLGIAEGGIAFYTSWGQSVRASWLSAVAGDLAGAESHLRSAIGDAEPRVDLALGLVQIMKLRCKPQAEIDAVLPDFVRRFPDSDALRAAYRDQLLASGNVAQAIDLYAKAVAQNPADVETVNSAAELYLRIKRPKEAEQLLRDGLVTRPRSPVLHTTLGAAMMAQNQAAQAEEALKKAVDHTPTSERRLRLADAIAAQRRFAEAEVQIRKALTDFEPTALAVSRFVSVLRIQSNPPDTVAAELAKLASRLTDAPSGEGPRQMIASQLIALGKADAAISMYGEALQAKRPALATIRNGAELLLVSKRPDDAEKACLEGLAKHYPNDGALYTVLGVARFAQNKIDGPAGCHAAFTRARELLDNLDPMAKLADELVRLNRFDEVEALYAVSVERSPGHLPTLQNAGGFMISRQKFDVALSLAEQGLKIHPCNAGLLDLSGRALYLLSRDAEAAERLTQAAEREPTADRFNNLAEIYARMGKSNEARAAQERAAALAR